MLAIACVSGCSQDASTTSSTPIAWTDVSATDGPSNERSTTDGVAGADAGPGQAHGRAYGLRVMRLTGSANELTRIHELYEQEISIPVSVAFDGDDWPEVQLELHGGYARTVPKKSYRLAFPDEDPFNGDLFGDGAQEQHRRFVLQACWIDQTFLRNKLTMDLIRELGGLSPRIGYVILEINGQWLGLYQLIERIDRPYLKRQKLDKDGNLYKAESHWANWAAKEDPLQGYDVQEGEENPHDDLGVLLDALSSTPATHADFEKEIAPKLNLDEFMTWQIVHTLAMNADTFTKNYYLYHDIDAPIGTPKARFRLISWDADATWGNSWDGVILSTDQPSWHGTDAFSPRLLSISEYRASYRDGYLEALESDLGQQVILLRVAAIESLIATAARADLLHWQREGNFDDETARLRDAIEARVQTMKTVMSELEVP